jgi:hypothetical protein
LRDSLNHRICAARSGSATGGIAANNRLIDAQNVAFAYIVSKETNIIARNITYTENSTSKPKNFIQGNIKFLHLI